MLELDHCDLSVEQVKVVLLDQPALHTLRCQHWTHASPENLKSISQPNFFGASNWEEEKKDGPCCQRAENNSRGFVVKMSQGLVSWPHRSLFGGIRRPKVGTGSVSEQRKLSRYFFGVEWKISSEQLKMSLI